MLHGFKKIDVGNKFLPIRIMITMLRLLLTGNYIIILFLSIKKFSKKYTIIRNKIV